MADAFVPDPKWNTVTKAINGFFGRKPGQNIQEFAAELKELSDAEKDQLGHGIMNGTLTY